MRSHTYQSDGKLDYDCNCTVCGGKHRDSVHRYAPPADSINRQAAAILLSGRGGMLPTASEQVRAVTLAEGGIEPATALLIATIPPASADIDPAIFGVEIAQEGGAQ